jgi:hypothetical protein
MYAYVCASSPSVRPLRNGHVNQCVKNASDPTLNPTISIIWLKSIRRTDLAQQPAPGVNPLAFSSSDGNPLGGCNFRNRKAGEISQLDQCGLFGLRLFELCQCLVERQQIQLSFFDGNAHVIERNAIMVRSVADGHFSPCGIHQYASHRFSSGCEQMLSAVPVRRLCAIDQFSRIAQ